MHMGAAVLLACARAHGAGDPWVTTFEPGYHPWSPKGGASTRTPVGATPGQKLDYHWRGCTLCNPELPCQYRRPTSPPAPIQAPCRSIQPVYSLQRPTRTLPPEAAACGPTSSLELLRRRQRCAWWRCCCRAGHMQQVWVRNIAGFYAPSHARCAYAGRLTLADPPHMALPPGDP